MSCRAEADRQEERNEHRCQGEWLKSSDDDYDNADDGGDDVAMLMRLQQHPSLRYNCRLQALTHQWRVDGDGDGNVTATDLTHTF